MLSAYTNVPFIIVYMYFYFLNSIQEQDIIHVTLNGMKLNDSKFLYSFLDMYSFTNTATPIT